MNPGCGGDGQEVGRHLSPVPSGSSPAAVLHIYQVPVTAGGRADQLCHKYICYSAGVSLCFLITCHMCLYVHVCVCLGYTHRECTYKK